MSLAAQMITQLKSEKEIVSALAFSNAPHLVREFKRYYGCTPKEYLLIESSRSATRKAMPPECRAFEEEFNNAAIHPRDQNILLQAHRKRIAQFGRNQFS